MTFDGVKIVDCMHSFIKYEFLFTFVKEITDFRFFHHQNQCLAGLHTYSSEKNHTYRFPKETFSIGWTENCCRVVLL